MVYVSVVLLKIIPIPCVRVAFKITPSRDFSVKMNFKFDIVVKLLVDLLMINRFTYVTKKKKKKIAIMTRR